MHNTRIRLAVQADLPQVAEIDYEAFAPYGTPEDLKIYAERLVAFPEGFLVAEIDGHIVGFVTSELWRDEHEPTMNESPLVTHHPDGKILCLTSIAVRQSFQKQGIGSALLERLLTIARAKHCTKILLETTHAQGFYLPYNFHVVREKLQWGVTLSIMVLGLEP